MTPEQLKSLWSHREVLAEIERLEGVNTKLEAENGRLTKELAEVTKAHAERITTVINLEAENEKLKLESLLQPHPYPVVPSITTDSTQPIQSERENRLEAENERLVKELAEARKEVTCGCGDIRPKSEMCHLCGNCQMGCCFCITAKEADALNQKVATIANENTRLRQTLTLIEIIDEEGCLPEAFAHAQELAEAALRPEREHEAD